MIEVKYYVSVDGIQFDTKEKCEEYEKNFELPQGVIAADYKGKRIYSLAPTNSSDNVGEAIYYIYLPTAAAIEWFHQTGERFDFETRGVDRVGYYYYDGSLSNGIDWRNIETVKEILKGE